MTSIAFTLPMLLDTPNRTRGQHWAVTSAYKRRVAQEVWIALGCRLPATPIERCRVTVYRHSTRQPDDDNLAASMKPLLDALQPATAKRRYGLGLIADDAPGVCLMVPRWIKATRGNQFTRVVIEPMP
jgi:hypothetical protein